MPQITAKTDPRRTVEEIRPNAVTRTRLSTQRATRIREFVCSHLPAHVDVEVIITPHVATAAVLPTDIDAVLDADATDVDREQAERLLEGVDTDYLVLVTGNPAPLERIPLNDQLTADHAHQFGLAFHELLHILKTTIVVIGRLLEEEIDEQYHEQVHDLINIIEDGAIETEAIQGENFSDNAGIRLELTRRIHSKKPADLPDGQQLEYSFWDAVTGALYDAVIYPTGITNSLLDSDDERISFNSDADKQAFEAVHDALEQLAEDALAIKSADRGDTTHSHDKRASVLRAHRVIETWKTAIQPVLEDQQTEDQERLEGSHQEADSGTGQPDPVGQEPSDSGQSGDAQNTGPNPIAGETPPDNRADELDGPPAAASDTTTASPPGDFDPSEVSLDREATDDPFQDVFDHPAITPDPDPEAIDTNDDDQRDTVDDPGKGHPSESETGDYTAEQASGSSVDADDSESAAGDGREVPADRTTDQERQSRAQSLAEATDRVREKEQERTLDDGRQGSKQDQQGCDGKTDRGRQEAPEGTAPDSDQITLGDFDANALDTIDEMDSDSGTEDEEEIGSGEAAASERTDDGEPDAQGLANGLDQANEDFSDTDAGEHSPDPVPSSSRSLPSSEDGASGARADAEPSGPAHDRGSNRSAEAEQEVYETGLEADRKAAHDEADRERIDQEALERELENLANAIDRDRRRNNTETESSAGTSGGPETLDDIDVLPITDDLAPPREWATIEEGAHQVASTLEKELRLERQRGERTGLTAGTYDTRAGHRLAIGDPRVCKTRTPGREKRYCLVLVLDRSGSMRNGSPPKIEVATRALARFAVAAEALTIRVAIIDFIHGEARLVKPFSVETRHIQSRLLDVSCGGGTPLADAIGLARRFVESQRDEPLIITVTDDEPHSIESVKAQIRESNAPVCSLTIATDCEPGTLSPDASALADYYERQAAVYTPERLDDRLDQFASLLAGL